MAIRGYGALAAVSMFLCPFVNGLLCHAVVLSVNLITDSMPCL